MAGGLIDTGAVLDENELFQRFLDAAAKGSGTKGSGTKESATPEQENT
jgi:hypothetical protein